MSWIRARIEPSLAEPELISITRGEKGAVLPRYSPRSEKKEQISYPDPLTRFLPPHPATEARNGVDPERPIWNYKKCKL